MITSVRMAATGVRSARAPQGAGVGPFPFPFPWPGPGSTVGSGLIAGCDGHGESGSVETQIDGDGGASGHVPVGANWPPQDRPNGMKP